VEVKVFQLEITDNLIEMAREAGVYEVIWRPEDIGIKTAKEVVEPLTQALNLMKADPERFKKLNPANRWGDYQYLLNFVQGYLGRARQYPDATIKINR
jgi:hypothetical protein